MRRPTIHCAAPFSSHNRALVGQTSTTGGSGLCAREGSGRVKRSSLRRSARSSADSAPSRSGVVGSNAVAIPADASAPPGASGAAVKEGSGGRPGRGAGWRSPSPSRPRRPHQAVRDDVAPNADHRVRRVSHPHVPTKKADAFVVALASRRANATFFVAGAARATPRHWSELDGAPRHADPARRLGRVARGRAVVCSAGRGCPP